MSLFLAKSFRARRKELDEQVSQGDLVTLKKIRAAMEVDAQKLTGFLSYAPAMSARGATLAAAAHALISYVGAALAIIIAGAKAVPDASRTRLIRRLLKPQLWFMTGMSESATALSNAMPKLIQLWGIDERVQGAFAQRLKSLAAVRYWTAQDFLKAFAKHHIKPPASCASRQSDADAVWESRPVKRNASVVRLITSGVVLSM